MNQDARVRLRMDTREAKGDMDNFVKHGKKAAGEVSGTISGAIKRGFGFVGAGAALGTGLAAVRGATQSGLGSLFGETFGAIGAQAAEFFQGELDEKAKASKIAREETIAAFGAIAGEAGRVPPAARAYFEQIRALRLNEERGRELFERDERFYGPGVGSLIDRLVSGVGEYITSGFNSLAESLSTHR